MTPVENKPKKLGLYLHIPFCAHKCDYCDFYSVEGHVNLMDPYLNRIQRMLKEWSLLTQDYTVDSIYIGGGTPSWFGSQRIARLIDILYNSFYISTDCEITVEGNPDSLTETVLRDFFNSGINRISIGVQSTQDKILCGIGRIHNAKQAERAFFKAREIGFQNISLDLIYGLPNQNLSIWSESVEQVLSWKPEHLSCYGLKIEKNTPLWERRDSKTLPNDDMQADMYLWVSRRLAREGFHHYEISNFAKYGFESRHNLKYWLGDEYVGFGPGAYSDFGGRRFGLIRDLRAFIDNRDGNNKFLLSEEESPDRKERAREYVMLQLRTDFGVEKEEYEEKFEFSFEPLDERFKFYAGHGFAYQKNKRWKLTPEGWLVSNLIIGELLELQEQTIH